MPTIDPLYGANLRPVEQKLCGAAAALDGPEGAELEEARKETGEGKTR